MQLEVLFRLVAGTAEVVTEVAAEGVAGGVVDRVAEAVAEHLPEGGAPERVAEAAIEGELRGGVVLSRQKRLIWQRLRQGSLSQGLFWALLCGVF